MPYSNVTHFPRPHDPKTHSIIGTIRIEASRWDEFDRKVSDQTQATVLGHDDAGFNMIDAHVATTTADVLRRLTARWSA